MDDKRIVISEKEFQERYSKTRCACQLTTLYETYVVKKEGNK